MSDQAEVTLTFEVRGENIAQLHARARAQINDFIGKDTTLLTPDITYTMLAHRTGRGEYQATIEITTAASFT